MKIIEKIKVPQDNVNDEFVMITEINYETNQHIKSGDLILSYETSKANFELFAKKDGYLKLLCKEGDSVEINKAIAEIYDSEIKLDKNTDELNSPIEQTISKKAQDLISKNKIDLSHFRDIKLVTEENVLSYLNNDINVIKSKNKISPAKLSEINNLVNTERLGLISTVTKTFDSSSYDLISPFKNEEFKNSISLLLVKSASELLSTNEFEHLNSYIENDEIIIYQEVNFGIALNLGNGLKLGVIKNSNNSSLEEIEIRVIDLIDNYIDNKLSIDDITGATVAMTDLTAQEITYFNPLIVKNNTIMIGLSGKKSGTQSISIAFDHRVSDGLEVSNFLNKMIDNIKPIKK